MMGIRFLRPPGARPEPEFLSRCLHCGQCAQVCPYDSIKLRTGFNFFLTGTPQIYPREIPCYLCMRCPEVCPSGALEQLPAESVKMGEARLDRNRCYIWRGQVICRSCFERCPLKGSAIILAKGLYPVITSHCAGCGVCEHVCPQQAITTIPNNFPI